MKLLQISIALPIEKHLEAVAAIADRLVDWGAEPYQSLVLLFSVRKHLLDHEGALWPAADGSWPDKKLKEVARLIGSPYPLDREVGHAWHKHILTPAGAWWAVETAEATLCELDEYQFATELKTRVRIAQDDSESVRA